MRRICSLFLTLVMVVGIFVALPVNASAATIDTLVPDEELTLQWASDTKYGLVSVDESGFYDITVNGNASYGFYVLDIYEDSNDGMYYTIGKPSESWSITSFPYTFRNLYLEKGTQYYLSALCLDSNYEYSQGDISLLLTKNDYQIAELTSSSKKVITDENELQWFTFETAEAGDYWFDFGGPIFLNIYDYNTGKFITSTGNDYGFVTLTLEANTKYKLVTWFRNINAKLLNVSCGKHVKTVKSVELYNAQMLADDYLDEADYNYKVTYTDNSTEIVDYYYFTSRGATLYLEYTGGYTDDSYNYKSMGEQPVSVYYNYAKTESTVEVISFLEYFSYLNTKYPYDDLLIEYENTYYQQYFWHIKITETGKYTLYTYDGWDTFSSYNIEFFDKNNNPATYTDGGWNLKKGQEYCMMIEYSYAEGADWDFDFTIEPYRDHVHTSSSWIIDKKATVNAPGSRHKECTDCGAIIKTEKIAQLKCAKPSLKTIANTATGVKITWSKVTGADTYEIYRKVKGGSYSKVGTTSKTYFTDKTAKSGKQYYYVVKAVNEAGRSSASNYKIIKYLADPVLKAPTSAKNGITLKWSKVTGASGYVVYRKTGNGSFTKLATVKGVSKVSYVDKTAKKGKKYTYKLKAYSGKTYSAYSNAKTIKDKY